MFHRNPAIFETDLSGHKAVYVSVLVNALSDIGICPKVLMPKEAVESKPFEVYLSPLREKFQHVSVPEIASKGTYRQEHEKLECLLEVISGNEIDHLYVPYGDALVQLMGTRANHVRKRLGSCRVESLIFRCRFAYPQRSYPKLIAAKLRLWAIRRAPLAKIHILDPHAFRWLASRVCRVSAKFSWMPEYLEPWGFNQAQVPEKESDHFDSLGFRGGVKTIGFLGAKGKRKGVELLLRAFSETSELHNSVLLLAGEHGRETRKLLTTKYSALVARRRIVSVDRFLSEEEFQNVFREIDLLCLPYRDHQAVSSIYLRAATLGKPTLASDKGWFSWAVPHYGHGEMVDVNSPGAFRESLLRFIKKPSQEHRITDQSEQILLENSPASVKDAWTALLRSRLSGSAF